MALLTGYCPSFLPLVEKQPVNSAAGLELNSVPFLYERAYFLSREEMQHANTTIFTSVKEEEKQKRRSSYQYSQDGEKKRVSSRNHDATAFCR